MQHLKSILVGTDFTPGSRAALAQAIRMAAWTSASVRAIHVIDTLVAMELEEALGPYQKNVRESLVADARRAWDSVCAANAGAAAVPLDVRIHARIPGILAAVREAKADLLVLGAYGETAPDVGFGTIATGCVRHAGCDVLLVRDTQESAFRCIVACVDFSPTSLGALERAARIATRDGAALHILYVFDAPWNKLHYRAPTPQAEPHFRDQYRQALERRLAGFAAPLGPSVNALKPVLALYEYQGYRSGIVEYATKAGADLIVLGTRGRSNLRDLLLGSTAEKVLRDTRCSVFAVRPNPSDPPGPTPSTP